jgi:hypothetical protein
MCTVLLQQGVNPTAVNKYINININTKYDDKETSVFFKSYMRWRRGGYTLTEGSLCGAS